MTVTVAKDKNKQPQPATNKPSPIKQKLEESKLNSSAQDIIDQLPDHAGQLLTELSKQYQIPLWQYTTGILLAVHLEGRLSEFRLDPAWKDGLKKQELKCKHCGKLFSPRHLNQPYCSNECGLKAAGMWIEEAEDKHVSNIRPNNGTDRSVPAAVGSSAWDDAPELPA